jgi:GTP cyclohydrolase-4
LKPKDVQALKINNSFILTRVGVTEVRKPIVVCRADREITTMATIDLFVDLPSTQKGSHMSRNIEVIQEVVDTSCRESVTSLEGLCLEIGKRLLEKHDYAKYSEVHLEAYYFLERTTPHGRPGLENYKLIAKAMCDRETDKHRKSIGVEVYGMTACPCAQETCRELLSKDYSVDLPDDFPNITHNQRNLTTIMVDVDENVDIEADDLIIAAEDAVSSPTYETLKRDDEAQIVYDAHKNPKFVEDVVRDVLKTLKERFTHLPDEAKITVRSLSEESIHKHNAFAERVTTMGKIRE